MTHTQRVIITGAPGTGKTSLIHHLKNQNVHCFEERARAIIKEQLDLGTNLVPWKNLVDFSKLVQQRQLEDYHAANPNQLNVYDRGLPDVLAYLHEKNHWVPQLEQTARENLYFNKVFLAPPWIEIFSKDHERREDVVDMLAIHHALVNTYETIGYQLVELPKVSVKERADFVLNEINM